MKPSWQDAPDWAKYLARSSDMAWVWHEFYPFENRNGTFDICTGKSEFASWVSTDDFLFERPRVIKI